MPGLDHQVNKIDIVIGCYGEEDLPTSLNDKHTTVIIEPLKENCIKLRKKYEVHNYFISDQNANKRLYYCKSIDSGLKLLKEAWQDIADDITNHSFKKSETLKYIESITPDIFKFATLNYFLDRYSFKDKELYIHISKDVDLSKVFSGNEFKDYNIKEVFYNNESMLNFKSIMNVLSKELYYNK
jgi:hypothetical protein|tara:strand:+ start:348 stop:899 length:552 start_codon:yes stop_codon:yes gene_type:complete